MRRRNILKNIVFTRIGEIRIQKMKPKLTDLLIFFRGKDKDYAGRKLRQLYANQSGDNNRDDDPRYEQLSLNFERLAKVFTIQN